MCLPEDVVDDCRQCIQKSLPRILPRVVFKCAEDNGQLTGTIICDLEVLFQTTSTISSREINSDICHPVSHIRGESNG